MMKKIKRENQIQLQLISDPCLLGSDGVAGSYSNPITDGNKQKKKKEREQMKRDSWKL